MENEIWRPIKGFEGLYDISTLGKIKSLRRNILLKPAKTTNGYSMVCLHKNGISTGIRIHRTVFFTFWDLIPGCPNPNEHPELEVNHKNGVKTDPTLSNLELVTRKENVTHAYDVLGHPRLYGQLGEANLYAKITKEDVFELNQWLESGNTKLDFAKKKGVSKDCIWDITAGRTWKHLGIDWSKFYQKRVSKTDSSIQQ